MVKTALPQSVQMERVQKNRNTDKTALLVHRPQTFRATEKTNQDARGGGGGGGKNPPKSKKKSQHFYQLALTLKELFF